MKKERESAEVCVCWGGGGREKRRETKRTESVFCTGWQERENEPLV
jgi:hypothetical protein